MKRTLVLAALAACGPQFPSPMTADQLVTYDTGPALVAYLQQPDASADVCDLRSPGPHLHVLTPDERSALVDGLVDGSIPPAQWRRCTDHLAARLDGEPAADLGDALLGAYRKLLGDGDVENSPAVVERLTTLHRFYLDRRAGFDAHPATLTSLVADLQSELDKHKVGLVAGQFARELLDTVELERATWHGKPIDAPMLDALAAAGNELTLRRFADRLHSDELRTEARRRIIRIHVALSPFREVQNGGPKLEARILAEGANAIDLPTHPITRAWFDDQAVKRDVIVREHVWDQTATLLGSSTDRASVSVLPELQLQGALMAEARGISRPISVCTHDNELDPSPCIAVADVTLDQPLAKLDAHGAIRLVDNIPMSSVVPLASALAFTLTVRIGGNASAKLEWGIRYELPDSLVFNAGPNITVGVEDPRPDRLAFDVTDGRKRYTAIVEKGDLERFRVASAGFSGSPGSTGSTGSTGSSGAECSSGGAGGTGGPGGNGGPGGPGGDVSIRLECSSKDCVDLQRELGGVIVSLGGAGGAAGQGGAGGAGGAGGPGRSQTSHVDSNGNTVVDDQGCSAGSSGAQGSSGSSGSPGAAGRAGHVSFQIAPHR